MADLEALKLQLEQDKSSLKKANHATVASYLAKIKEYVGTERFTNGKFELATELFTKMILNETLDEFLTLKAYEHIQ